ncbi:MAG: glycosyltransferase family 87 protein [Syntrophales bacterium]
MAAKAWVQGINPYDHTLLPKLWEEKGGEPENLPNFNLTPSLYPITTYVILSPLGLFKWYQAKYIFSTVNLLSFIPMYFALLLLIRGHLFGWQAILLLALSLALCPFTESILLGQPALLAASLLMVSLWISTLESRRDILSGVLLALSLSLKPQIGIIFFIYFGFSRRWAIITSCFSAIIIVILIGILRIGLDDFHWINGWMGNLQIAFGSGGVNDPIISNRYAIFLTNLHYPLHNLISNKFFLNCAIIAIALIEILIFRNYVNINTNNYCDNLLYFSVLSIINLIAFYHRHQDAILLVIPLSLIVLLLGTRYKYYALLLLFTISPFMNPLMLGFAIKSREYYLNHCALMVWHKKIFLLCLSSYQCLSLFIFSVLLIYLAAIRTHDTG